MTGTHGQDPCRKEGRHGVRKVNWEGYVSCVHECEEAVQQQPHARTQGLIRGQRRQMLYKAGAEVEAQVTVGWQQEFGVHVPGVL